MADPPTEPELRVLEWQRSDEEALRAAVAAGAASTLELGAGRFEPREAGRLVASVDAAQLEPAAR